MEPKEYLQGLLASQDLSERQEKDLQAHKKEVTDFLREEFGVDPVIKYAGSRVKGTMISDRYDLDIVCYFPSSDDRALKEIREDVTQRLAEKYQLAHKASAERIIDLKGAESPFDYHIDVVPGRFIKDTKDVYLHVAYGDKERMRTNLKVHITHITESGCEPVIRLLKLWSHRNNVPIKTFVLELFVVKALSGSKNKGNLQKSILKVLEEFKDNFSSTQLVDPANTNNIVSQLMNESEKAIVVQSAKLAYDLLAESDDIEKWQTVFVDKEAKLSSSNSASGSSAVGYAVGSSFRPNKPWSGSYDNRV